MMLRRLRRLLCRIGLHNLVHITTTNRNWVEEGGVPRVRFHEVTTREPCECGRSPRVVTVVDGTQT